ncbi:MAG TPA: S41 family peptidase [Terriglobales bacterium]
MLSRIALFLVVGTVCAWPQAPAIPETPAGRALEAWLDVFNGGDRPRIEAYVAKYDPTDTADELVAFREQTGGFELVGVDKSEPLEIKFHVKEKAGPTIAVATIKMKDANSGVIASFMMRAIPPGMTPADMSLKIDAATRARVIDGALANLNEFYIYPETAKKMEEALRTHQKKGDYDSLEDAEEFADLLTNHLQDVSHDKHLHVAFSPRVLPKDDRERDPEAEARMRTQLERNNCFFDKVEHLPGNIGYVKFNAFPNPQICGSTVTAAMGFVANSEALIFDLRQNGGGDPKMVQFISSYLFDEPTHLNDMYNRKEDSTTQYWTLPYVPGKRFAGKPVFVLTSTRTFSGAEEFTYNLKNLKRATIIGETTGGGAHPVSGHRIDDHFMIGVPGGRPINPISKKDWEGTGVEPDVKVPADQALDIAKKMAAEEIQKKARDEQVQSAGKSK